MMVPLSHMFLPSKIKHFFKIYAIGMAIAGLLTIIITYSTGILMNSMLVLFGLGFIAYQWIANFQMIRSSAA